MSAFQIFFPYIIKKKKQMLVKEKYDDISLILRSNNFFEWDYTYSFAQTSKSF